VGYTPVFFATQELVPPSVYEALGESALLVMDDRILKTADTIRDFFKAPVIINDWIWNPDEDRQRTLSGFRPCDTKLGAKYSQHKFGRAIDCLIPDLDIEDVREAILSNRDAFPYITAMELVVPWLHVDCRTSSRDDIILFKP
jgi:hypothetical protein